MADEIRKRAEKLARHNLLPDAVDLYVQIEHLRQQLAEVLADNKRLAAENVELRMQIEQWRKTDAA